MKEKNLLQVGDVIFKESRLSRRLTKYTITRVTKTQAISEGVGGINRFIREYDFLSENTAWINSYPKNSDWSSPRYSFGTPKLEERYSKEKAIQKIIKANLYKLPLTTLNEIANLIIKNKIKK